MRSFIETITTQHNTNPIDTQYTVIYAFYNNSQ
jgi:hypothetical protein